MAVLTQDHSHQAVVVAVVAELHAQIQFAMTDKFVMTGLQEENAVTKKSALKNP
ncbi:hypothetical protein D3C87_1913430 [compost metagenome]